MEKDLKRILIESAIRKTLRDIRTAPERSTRNLIDMGLACAKGRFQRYFLSAAQKMLEKEDSQYYALAKQTVNGVDWDILTTFGINVGYNSYTRGAKTIRTIEAREHFNIPWSLRFSLPEEARDATLSSCTDIIKQGTALGIYTYLLHVGKDPCRVLPLVQAYRDCAFVLFVSGDCITDTFLKQAADAHNIMISVRADADCQSACRRLREKKLLCAVHQEYGVQNREQILDGSWLSSILPSRPTFALLLPDASCPAALSAEVYRYVRSVRSSQDYPVLLVDCHHDSLMIDRIISGDACIFGFDETGALLTNQYAPETAGLNFYTHTLKDIFRIAAPKKGEPHEH